MDRLNEYKYKAKILRQIHSNRAVKYKRINSFQSILTVIVSSFITFIGFYGIDKLNKLINNFWVIDITILEFLFNLFVFILFVNVILHLVFSFNKKQTEADNAIVLLSSLINEITDIDEGIKINALTVNTDIIESIRYKYQTITSVIPPNTDKQFLNAKKDYKEKEETKAAIEKININIFDEDYLLKHTSLLIKNSPLYQYLLALRDVNPELYLGGGAVRNLVWDELHGYSMISQISDLDIIYFDNLNTTKEHDKRIEGQLYKKIPNIKWSVKNQARMHIWNKEDAYISIEDAISKWPETCTALAVRINNEGEIEFIKPFGFGDLYRLIVKPTPHFKTKADRFIERYKSKMWERSWPKLKIIEP